MSNSDAVRETVTAAVKQYSAACEEAGQELAPVDARVNTTEALTLACALLRSQGLTPFDMALWFSRGAIK